jgi:hypothetical protein
VYSLFSLVSYPKRVHFASLTLSQLSTGPEYAPKQGNNHNLDSVALNYPFLVSQLRVMSHNRTKCRENGTREQNYFLSIMPMQVYSTPLGSRMGTATPPPTGDRVLAIDVFYVDGGCSRISSSGTSQAACRRCFLALMVGALGSPALAPPRGPTIDIFYIDGGRSWIFISTH